MKCRFNLKLRKQFKAMAPTSRSLAQYHATVINAIDGAGPKGGPIDGFFVEFETADGQLHGEAFFRPDLSRSGGAQMAAKRKATAFSLPLG